MRTNSQIVALFLALVDPVVLRIAEVMPCLCAPMRASCLDAKVSFEKSLNVEQQLLVGVGDCQCSSSDASFAIKESSQKASEAIAGA